MGKVKTEHIKKLARELMNRFPEKFSGNFDENKQTVAELTEGATTKVRNKVAGYITRTVASALSESSEKDLEDESIV
ncbi:MAG: 30S ribosomal protein S17e [Candidatus Bathyarchaeota archaeon]|nr:30S ribosomal protein S17e [Candidatus Bathyarchaeota archaeon]